MVSTPRAIRRLSWACLLLLVPPWAGAGELRVAVASNFLPAAEVLAERFEQRTRQRVTLAGASTGKLYAQIVAGAPWDVLLAADRERPERLEREGRALAGSRFTYALGRLVLWSPDPGRVDPQGKVLSQDTDARLAIANPRLAPYGRAARETLEDLGLWTSIQPRLVRGENVAQALLFARAGGAELALVARAQVAAPGRTASGSSWLVPAGHHAPIEQQAVRLTDREGAAEWLAFLAGDEGRALIAAQGYDLP